VVHGADFFIACLSEHFFGRRTYGRKEIKLAMEIVDMIPKSEIFFIPVRLSACELEPPLSEYHWVDLFTARWIPTTVEIPPDKVTETWTHLP
jgi:hypothetical protein